MEWINTKKQKPKEGQEIIAVNDFKKEIIGYAIYEGNILCCENESEMISHVIFWFPKPNIPVFNWRQ